MGLSPQGESIACSHPNDESHVEVVGPEFKNCSDVDHVIPSQ